ncbi:unnamed protein product [Orchesella dallaii]
MSRSRATPLNKALDENRTHNTSKKSHPVKPTDKEIVTDKRKKSSKPLAQCTTKKHIPNTSISKTKKIMETITFTITTRKSSKYKPLKNDGLSKSGKKAENLNKLMVTAKQNETPRQQEDPLSSPKLTREQIKSTITIEPVVCEDTQKVSDLQGALIQASEKHEEEILPLLPLDAPTTPACRQEEDVIKNISESEQIFHTCEYGKEEDLMEQSMMYPGIPPDWCFHSFSQFPYGCFPPLCDYPVYSGCNCTIPEQGANESLHQPQYDYEYSLMCNNTRHRFGGQRATIRTHTHTFCDITIDTEPELLQTRLPDITIDHNGKCKINSSCLVSTDGQNYNINGFDVKFFKSQVTPENTGKSIRLDFQTDGFVEPDSFETEVDENGNIFVTGIIFGEPSKLWISVPVCENPDLVTVENPNLYYYTVEVPY